MSAHEAREAGIRMCIDCMPLRLGKGRAGKWRGLGRAGGRAREACRQDRGKRGQQVGVMQRRAKRHAELRTAPECQVECLRSQSCGDIYTYRIAFLLFPRS